MRKIKSIFVVFTVLLFTGIFTTESEAATKTVSASQVVNYLNAQVGKSYPNNYCLKFVSDSWVAISGAARSSACCAYNYGSSHIVSTNMSDIPIGADVYFGGSNSRCSHCGKSAGHVGIYVGGGYMVHATGGKVQKSLVSAWASRWRGWGWHSNISVAADTTPVAPTVNPSVTPSINHVTITDIAYDHISLTFSCSNTAYAKVVVKSKTTGEEYHTEITNGFDQISYTFNKNVMSSNAGSNYYVRIYAYAKENGSYTNETLHAVTYGNEIGSVELTKLGLQYYLEAVPSSVDAKSEQALAGWVIDESGISRVTAVINGVAEYECDRCNRDDVYAVYPEYKYRNEGFCIALNHKMFVDGENTVALRAYTNDGRILDFASVQIQVSNKPYKAYMEGIPCDYVVTQSSVWGWFIDDENVDRITAIVNGSNEYLCSRIDRSDVRDAFPEYGTLGKEGFQIEFTNKMLKDGDNAITLRAYYPDGTYADFANVGAQAIILPKELFDPAWYYGMYADENPEIKEIGQKDLGALYDHYLDNLDKGYSPSMCFSPAKYMEYNTDLKSNEFYGDGVIGAYAHYVNCALRDNEQRVFSEFFNAKYYHDTYADLAALDMNAYDLTKHMLVNGIYESRLGADTDAAKALLKMFSCTEYAKENQDVKKIFGDGTNLESAQGLWQHFCVNCIGGNEARKTAQEFSMAYYKENNHLKTTREAFWHYINTGYGKKLATEKDTSNIEETTDKKVESSTTDKITEEETTPKEKETDIETLVPEKRMYTVVFMDENDEVISIQQVEEGESAIEPELEREGYSVEYDEEFDAIWEDTEINVSWIPNVYTVKFNANKGSVSIKRSNVTFGESYGDLPVPERGGYVFEGWFTSKNGGEMVTEYAEVTTAKSHTLYAHWRKVTVPEVIMQKAARNKTKITFRVKKQEVDGYQVVYATNKKFSKGIKLNFVSAAKTIKNLKKEKVYYVKVRAYCEDSKGNPVYGNWSRTYRFS